MPLLDFGQQNSSSRNSSRNRHILPNPDFQTLTHHQEVGASHPHTVLIMSLKGKGKATLGTAMKALDSTVH
jgi:hypothetical protein